MKNIALSVLKCLVVVGNSTMHFGSVTQARLIIPPPLPVMPPFALESGDPLAQIVTPRLIPILI